MAGTAVNYKCPNCTAPLTFTPGATKIGCEFCGGEFEVSLIEELYAKEQEMAVKKAAAEEQKWAIEEAGENWNEDEINMMKAFTCSSCGAEIVCDENTMATECCYCGNTTMMPGRFDGMLKPDYIIPFKKTKEEAKAAFKEFCKGKTLLPDEFTANNRIEAIQGMYVPFWLFDSSVEATATFKATKVRTYQDGDDDVTETSHYRCERQGSMSFEKIPADGSSKMRDDFMESIEPFDYSEMIPFSNAYMAGYLADKYDVDAEASVGRADTRVNTSAVDALENTVMGYDSVDVTEAAVVKEKGDVKYAIVPVWIMTTRYNGEGYTFMMNGQTGKFIGSLPYSKSKANKQFWIAFVITFILVYLGFIACMD